MLLKDVKNSRKVNLAIFRQVQLQYVSVLGSRKLTSGTGAFLVSLVVLKYGTGHTGPQSTKSADQPPGFGPLFKPVLFLFLPPFPVSNWEQCYLTRPIGSSLPLASRKGCGRDYSGKLLRAQPAN
jgi:hypothetical protein